MSLISECTRLWCTQCHAVSHSTHCRLDIESESKQQLLEESQAVAGAMSAQHAELVDSLKHAIAEGHSLRRALATAHEEGKKRDALVLVNRQLESARHFDRAAQDKELRRMQMEHNRQLTVMQDELGRISELMASNNLLRIQLDKATTAASALKVCAGVHMRM